MIDATGHAERAAQAVARRRLRDAGELDGEARKAAAKWAMASESEPRLRALLTLAGTQPTLVLQADELDRDPYLLACANGTINLRTGSLRAGCPADLISLGTDVAYDPGAYCSRWLQHLEEVFGDDQETVAWLQRFIGYALTGDTREQCVVVAHGIGANGKDTTLKPIMRILGDFAATTPSELFTRSRGDKGVRNNLARLHRRRGAEKAAKALISRDV